MTTPSTIRDVRPDDARGILDIYGPVVAQSPTSFETETPSIKEMQQRIRRASERWPWIVMEGQDRLCGYAYATRFRSRAAYQNTAETTVYVHEQDRGQGVGRDLMQALLTRLRAIGLHRAIAGVTLPNPASIRLHESLGYQKVGVFHEIGRKFDAWHDVSFWELDLSE